MQEHSGILIERWLEKSQAAMETAEDNVINNNLEGALNRIYYAIFYMVMALAEKENFVTSKHAKLMGWFNKKFIYEDKTFDAVLFETYKKSFAYRQDSDYDAMYNPDLEEVKLLLDDAKVFVEIVRKVVMLKQ